MSVKTITEIESLFLDDLQANVSTDAPLTTGGAGDGRRFINDAYRLIWEMSGGSITAANHATLWTPSPAVAGTRILTGALTSVGEILHLWVGTTVGSTGTSTGDTELDRVELSQIQWLRARASSTVLGTYAESKLYAVSRIATVTPASINKLQVDVWPDSAGTRYYPAHYIPQYTDLDGTNTTPDVNDTQSSDIAHLAALWVAPLLGREDLMEGIALKISEGTRLMLERKKSSLLDARQDR